MKTAFDFKDYYTDLIDINVWGIESYLTGIKRKFSIFHLKKWYFIVIL